MYYSGLEKKIIQDCLRARAGERILITGHDFTSDLIESLRQELRAIKAVDIVITWSDRIIVELIRNLGVKEAALRIMPFFSEKKTFHFLHREIEADKIIVIIPPTDNYLDFLSVISYMKPFEDNYLYNLFQLQRMNVPGLLIDYPFDTKTRNLLEKEQFDHLLSSYRNAIGVNFQEIGNLNRRIVPFLKFGKEVLIRSDYGTDLRFIINGRFPCEEEGRLGFQTSFCQLPGGEVFIAPLEESACGVYMIDISDYGFILGMKFQDGVLMDALDSRGIENDKARKIIKEMGLLRERLGEFGIGTNSQSPPLLIGTISEKSLGTVHIALGENRSYGGKNASAIHYDFVSTKNDVFVDGKKIMEKGRIIV
ncbi:MAG TPA: aminopeptidase [Candidatus Eremiobacteraeota bacterium]|nr:MAG: Thermophilic metalloprotease (M29) [bacterium ADurb.Bin363]HPZ09166.1 aminopeptidase [Candidatus Eremiobacteraeota bacterium]